MAYDRDDIERVRQATDLVELVDAVTTVKKKGRSTTAICPFHQEKTPSLSIDPARGLFHCFGCQAGGDVFKFVQETQGLEFAEAVEHLAARAGITLRRDPRATKRRGERERLVDTVEKAVAFYQDRLKRGSDAGPARSYLRSRGYDADLVDEFQLGYAPEERGWSTLVEHFRELGVNDRTMTEAGLATRSGQGRLRDWFHGRVLFPIRDVRGAPVGFGARKLQGEGPKYLNTPETRLYRKAELLYGLDRAKAAITREGQSLVVEGYTDVIALHQAGLDTAVAACGTALGESHFDLLRRFADRVVLAFDADEAGAGAALRSDELTIPAELALDLRVAVMPAGKDPADLVQDGEEDALRSAVDESQPLLLFRMQREIAQHRLDEPEDRARAIRGAAEVIGRQPDALARGEYARMAARLIGAELETVLGEVESTMRRTRRRPDPKPSAPKQPSGQEKAERALLRILARQGVGGLEVTPELFAMDRHRRAFELLSPLLSDLESDKIPDLGVLEAEDPSGAAFLRALALEESPDEDPAELQARLSDWALGREIGALREQVQRLHPDDSGYSGLADKLVDLERRRRGA